MARKYYITNISSFIPYKDEEERKNICDQIKETGFVMFCIDQPETSFFVYDEYDTIEEARTDLSLYTSEIRDHANLQEIRVWGFYIEIYDDEDEGAALEYEEGELKWNF